MGRDIFLAGHEVTFDEQLLRADFMRDQFPDLVGGKAALGVVGDHSHHVLFRPVSFVVGEFAQGFSPDRFLVPLDFLDAGLAVGAAQLLDRLRRESKRTGILPPALDEFDERLFEVLLTASVEGGDFLGAGRGRVQAADLQPQLLLDFRPAGRPQLGQFLRERP